MRKLSEIEKGLEEAGRELITDYKIKKMEALILELRAYRLLRTIQHEEGDENAKQ